MDKEENYFFNCRKTINNQNGIEVDNKFFTNQNFAISPSREGKTKRSIVERVCPQYQGKKKQKIPDFTTSRMCDNFDDVTGSEISNGIDDANNTNSSSLLSKYEDNISREEAHQHSTNCELKTTYNSDMLQQQQKQQQNSNNSLNFPPPMTNRKRELVYNNDIIIQIPPPDPSLSLQQLQQQNQFLRQQLQLQQQQLQQIQQHLQHQQYLPSTSFNNYGNERMEENPYNDENQSLQMNRYGDIRDDIPDGYNMSNPSVVNCNNENSSQHYSCSELSPPPFIRDDEPNVQNYPPVELVPIIEHQEHYSQSLSSLPNQQQQHSEQPLKIPDYNNTQQVNQSSDDIRIETPPLLPSPTSSPLLSSPTLSPLNNSTYQLGKNQWQSPSMVNEVYKQPEINTTVSNIKANENANANMNVNRRMIENETKAGYEIKENNALYTLNYAKEANENDKEKNNNSYNMNSYSYSPTPISPPPFINDPPYDITSQQSQPQALINGGSYGVIPQSEQNNAMEYQCPQPYFIQPQPLSTIPLTNLYKSSVNGGYNATCNMSNPPTAEQEAVNTNVQSKDGRGRKRKQEEREERKKLVTEAKKTREKIKTTQIELIVDDQKGKGKGKSKVYSDYDPIKEKKRMD